MKGLYFAFCFTVGICIGHFVLKNPVYSFLEKLPFWLGVPICIFMISFLFWLLVLIAKTIDWKWWWE